MFRETLGAAAVVLVLWPVAGFSAGKLSAPEPPSRERYVKYSYQVVLPENMRKALKAHSPAFRIFGIEDYDEEFKKSVPLTFSSTACYSAVFTDLNGDGRADAVVYGEADLWIEHRSAKGIAKEEYFLALAVLSEGTTGYRVVQVFRGIAYRPVQKGLTVLGAGTAVDDWDYTTLDVKDNDIGLIVAENLSVFRWQGKGETPEFRSLPPVKAASYRRREK
ncbi:MAG: hypothetical protein FD189_2031 [Elusimicrobia bacterium]|nr:MAG: hypothetical protein FD154_2105 [Elusimicrobiota bacterium]KAF0154217.1 MAG: hypothetical protein FD189_2031 [Elusimicrobiota bacterium]